MPSGWQRGQDVVQDALEEIAEAGEGEVVLGLDRLTGDETQPSLAGQLHTFEPERRLPDPGLAFEDERSRSVDSVRVDERPKLLDLVPAAYHLARHRS